MIDIVIPGLFWKDILENALQQRLPVNSPVWYLLGETRLEDARQLIVRPPQRRGQPGESDTPGIILAAGSSPDKSFEFWAGKLSQEYQDIAVIIIGTREAQGRLVAALWRDSEWLQIDRLILPGAGMHYMELSPGSKKSGEDKRTFWTEDCWSRTIGALGRESWDRVRELRYGIIGCGRLGSSCAGAIGRNGAKHITLVDPDTIELHNLGESEGFTSLDIGFNKSSVLAQRLTMAFPWISSQAIPSSVSLWKALHALKSCDVLICCADTDSARLATALIACLYSRVLLDIGTRVTEGENNQRNGGADIRLVVPGDGCLLCRGGVLNGEAAVKELLSADAESALPSNFDWRSRRAGSLRSLNMTAVGLGIHLLEKLITGQQEHSTWLQLSSDTGSLPILAVSSRKHFSPGCFCAHQGRGDDALQEVPQILREAHVTK